MRIGIGYDVHRLEQGQKLILGGVEIDWHLGLAGHSDADVLIHAVCDACMGAAGLGDMGMHFPPGDGRFEDIDSRKLLRRTAAKLIALDRKICNVDCTIIAEKPKMRPFMPQMCVNISRDLGIREDQVNIKATTTEGLGFAGREKGIAAQAVVLIDDAEKQLG